MKTTISTGINNFLSSKFEEESVSYFFAAICIVLIPLYTWYIPPFLALWGITRIIEIYLSRKKWEGKPIVYADKKLSFLFVLFFSLQVAGLIYSENLKNGLNIVLSRFSLLIFPILFISPGNYIDKNRNKLLKLFAGATTIYIVFCYFYALFRSFSLNNGQLIINTHPPEGYWLSYFFGSYFSANQHPSYVAIFVLFSIVITLESIITRTLSFKFRLIWIVAFAILISSLYFLSSRSALIIVFIIIPLYIYLKFKAANKINTALILIVLLTIAGFSIIRTNGRISYYMNQVTKGSIKEMLVKDSRILIWQSSFKIINENLILGVGIGDVRDELMVKYREIGDQDLIASKYNAHNQFLEITIEGGIVSLISFLLIIFYMTYSAIINKNLLLIFFVAIMIFFFMFETVLYRLAGIIFFSYFSFLLIKNPSTKRLS